MRYSKNASTVRILLILHHRDNTMTIESVNPTPQPTGIEAEVCKLIAQRQQLGIAKYGQTVADNPLSLRAWLQHALEETLDQAVYLRRAIAEIDANTASAYEQSARFCDQLSRDAGRIDDPLGTLEGDSGYECGRVIRAFAAAVKPGA